jgi:hypothetical protein
MCTSLSYALILEISRMYDKPFWRCEVKTLFDFSYLRFFEKLFDIISFGITKELFKNTSEIENFIVYRLYAKA